MRSGARRRGLVLVAVTLTQALGRNPGVVVAALDLLSNLQGGKGLELSLIESSKLETMLERAVVDGLTGQDAVNVAEEFDDKIGVTGVVLTRMDGDGRGGGAHGLVALRAFEGAQPAIGLQEPDPILDLGT